MRRWLLTALLCLATVPALAASMLGRPGGGTIPATFAPLCGGSNPTCAFALSTERKMVSSATKAIQVERSVDSTTQDVGFTGTGLVNTATVDGFCNASVAGVISRNCFISEVYDQEGSTSCSIYNATPSAMPDYIVDPGHQGLPRLQKANVASGLNFYLDNNGGSAGTLTNPCTPLTGPNQSFFCSGNSSYGAFNSGQMGLQENTIGAVSGTMFSCYIGPSGQTFDRCVIGSPCGGADTESQGPQYNYTRTSNDDFIDIAVAPPTSATSPWNIWINNVNAFPNDNTTSFVLATQNRMSWGCGGDHTECGPNIYRTEAFYTSSLNSGQVASLYSNETAFAGALTQGYVGPGDNLTVGNETSYSSGLTNFKVQQMFWLAQAFSMRKTYASYEGPALNVCQGATSTCEDIGFVNNIIDTATMSAYCGPVSGLNDCTVQVWYNQALNESPSTNGVNTGADATAVSAAHRPTIAWSGCGTTAITVCVAFVPTNYFVVASTNVAVHSSLSGFTFAAVGQRTGAFTSNGAIYAETFSVNYIGWNTSASTCAGSATNPSTFVTESCADSSPHSIIVDASRTGPLTTIYADGTAGGTTTTAIDFIGSSGTKGLGAAGNGANGCTCTISEFLLFGDASNGSYATGLGATAAAALTANQRAGFGF